MRGSIRRSVESYFGNEEEEREGDLEGVREIPTEGRRVRVFHDWEKKVREDMRYG
jgi:hypothetical protein